MSTAALLIAGLFAIATILKSCSSNNVESEQLYEIFSQSLDRSRLMMEKQMMGQLKELEGKMHDPSGHYKAKYWYPKANRIDELTHKALQFVDSIQAMKTNSKKSLKEINTLLLKRLITYENDMFAVDADLREQFYKINPGFPRGLNAQDSPAYDLEMYLNLASHTGWVALLTQCKNHIFEMGVRMIEFCNLKVMHHEPWYTTYSAIIGQNSKTILPGEPIEITAGIGAFTIEGKPEVKISGISVPLNEEGVAIYKEKGPTNPGNYTIPVAISFTDQDGKKQEIIKPVNYTVKN